MNVGLIFGGNSYEHNVSIVSAKIISKIIRKNHNLALLFFDYDNNLYLIKNIEQDDIKKKAIKINLVKGGFKTKFRRYKLDVLFSIKLFLSYLSSSPFGVPTDVLFVLSCFFKICT